MNCKVEKTKNANEIKLEITVESTRFDEAIKKVYFKSAKYFNIPGFRKGKAPMQIVEKYYGKEIFYEDAFNEVAQEALEEAIKENKLEVVSRPDIEVTQIEKGKDLIFTAVVQTKPEVTLGKYKGIQVKKVEYNVSDEDVEHELMHLAEKNARLVSVEDRPVESGDITVIDFEGFVDGVAFEGGKAENYALEIGSGQFIPGFEEQMLGMKEGEERELNVKFPDEYHSENLKGKDAIFKVKVHEIKEKQIPELNDEFVLELELDGVKTKEEYEKHVEAELLKGKEAEAKRAREKAIIQTICDNAKVDIPESLIDMRKSQMIRQVESQAKQYGLSLEQFLSFQGLDLEQYKEVLTEPAKASVTEEVVLDAIVSKEKIKLTKKELEAEIKKLAEHYQMEVEEFKSKIDLQELESYLAIDKAKALVFEKAIIK